MRTLLQCLRDYPDALIEAIALERGVELTASARRDTIDQLSAVLLDPHQLQGAVSACSPAAMGALRELIGNDGWVTSAKFTRSYGPIRAFGPARLRRETPWKSPIGVSEELWYRGLISRGFAPIAGRSVEIIFIPTDIVSQLGLKGAPRPTFEIREHPSSVLPTSADNAFTEDMCTLLSTVDTQQLPTDYRGNWTDKAASVVNERLILTSSVASAELLRTGTPIALLVHLATRLGWLQTGRRRVQLLPALARDWLEASRTHQRDALWDSWRDDPEWDDLCRVPVLHCEGTWSHEPRFARKAILNHLRRCTPGAWYRIVDFVAAVKTVDADFLRPEGNYDSWYIRHQLTGDYLSGFQQWDAVEGSMIAHVIMGPAFWMSETALAIENGESWALGNVEDSSWLEDQRLNSMLFSLSAHSDAHSASAVQENHALETPTISVLQDFSIQVEEGTSLIDRFRIGRFADWQSSQPSFQYRITQRSLTRALERGIGPVQISAFLTRVTHDRVSPNVLAGLKKWKEH